MFLIAGVLAGWGFGIANVLRCFLFVVVACCDCCGLRFHGVGGSTLICVFAGCGGGLVCWCVLRALLFFDSIHKCSVLVQACRFQLPFSFSSCLLPTIKTTTIEEEKEPPEFVEFDRTSKLTLVERPQKLNSTNKIWSRPRQHHCGGISGYARRWKSWRS